MPSTVKNSKTSKLIPPFKRLLSKMPTWALISANVMHSWGYFVMLSWMPIYFNTIYRVDLRQAAWFSAVPWVMMAVLGYFSGVWSDMLIQNGKSVTFTRKVMQVSHLSTILLFVRIRQNMISIKCGQITNNYMVLLSKALFGASFRAVFFRSVCNRSSRQTRCAEKTQEVHFGLILGSSKWSFSCLSRFILVRKDTERHTVAKLASGCSYLHSKAQCMF
uniref:Anion transporter 4, chloroplastic n=1 Tax=Nelumbo nucifera TaxID=4432 RepID=A0A822Y2F6_NELNU|nr:TPA_asm: hypothetical protein HUJ06_028095 [Nelumbo nucifera]